MKKIKEFYKNNRVFVILMAVACFCLAIILVLVGYYFIDQTKGNFYGDRLNGIETVEINDAKISELEKAINENEIVQKTSIRILGKIIYINVYLKDGKASDAKNVAIKSLDLFSEDEKAFYDISYIFAKPDEKENSIFPIMGYKKSDNTIIAWTHISE